MRFRNDNYVGNLAKAAESVRNLSLEYDKTASSLAKDSNISLNILIMSKKQCSSFLFSYYLRRNN
jgi:hypothetical protein